MNPEVWHTLAGKTTGDADAHPPSQAEQRRRTQGFAPPFPLEPELQVRAEVVLYWSLGGILSLSLSPLTRRVLQALATEHTKALHCTLFSPPTPLAHPLVVSPCDQAEMHHEANVKATEARAARQRQRLTSGTSSASSSASVQSSANSGAIVAPPGTAASVARGPKLLGFGAGVGGGFGALVASVVVGREAAHVDSGWRCVLDKPACLQVWALGAHALTATSTATQDERKVHQLLVKYNGAWSDYQVNTHTPATSWIGVFPLFCYNPNLLLVCLSALDESLVRLKF